jgi:hypothetical protein
MSFQVKSFRKSSRKTMKSWGFGMKAAREEKNIRGNYERFHKKSSVVVCRWYQGVETQKVGFMGPHQVVWNISNHSQSSFFFWMCATASTFQSNSMYSISTHISQPASCFADPTTPCRLAIAVSGTMQHDTKGTVMQVAYSLFLEGSQVHLQFHWKRGIAQQLHSHIGGITFLFARPATS